MYDAVCNMAIYSLCTIKQYLKYLKFIPPRIVREDYHPEGITPQQKYFLLFSSLSRKVYNMLFNQMDFLVSVFNLPMLSVIYFSANVQNLGDT